MIQSVNGIPFADYTSAIKNGNEQRLRITFPNKNLDEEDVYEDGITYSAVLNGDNDLTIGKAVCASVFVPLVNDGTYANFNFKQQFTVEIGVVINNVCEYAPLGVFIGEKPKRLMGDTIELIGYDLMTLLEKETAEKNAKDFLTSLTYPLTIGQIFDALCVYYEVDGDRTQAINATRQITSAPFGGEGITGRDILAWIAEACGCYARFSRTGVCELVWFETTSYSIDGYDYFTIEPMEYDVDQIDQVRVQVTEKDVGTNYPSDGTFYHTYAVIDNPYLYATEASDLATVTQNLYTRLHAFPVYTPCNVYADGNWLVECGDIITVVDLDDTTEITLPIFSLTLNWSGRAECTYESTGSEEREAVTTVQRQMIRLNTKYHELEVDIDTLRSMIVASSFHIYEQVEDPVDTVGQSALVRGDLWVKPETQDTESVTKCWNGSEWIVVIDNAIIAEQSSLIQQNADAISAEVRRANSAEGTLQTNIDQTAENIRLGVTSAGKVETVGSYILIQSDKIDVNSDGSINLKAGATFTVASNNFSIDANGNVTMSGNVTATTGKIGGWYIGSDYLGNRNTKASSSVGLHALDENETASDTYVFWAGNSSQSSANFSVKGDGTVSIKKGSLDIGNGNFIVDTTGDVTIKRGSITIGSNFAVTSTGEITAKAGTVGGWHIGTDYIGNAETRLGSSIGLRANATGTNYALWLGGTLDYPSSWSAVESAGTWEVTATHNWQYYLPPPFYVRANGKMYSTGGQIGGWNISEHSLTSSLVGLSSDDDITFWAGNASARSANFRIYRDGRIYIGSGSISIGGSASSPNFLVTDEGIVTIKSGSIDITQGSIALGNKFSVTSEGVMRATDAVLTTVTARSGYIGNGSSGWKIGYASIYNGLSGVDGTTVGTYVGVDGLAVYKDAQHSFSVERGTGYLTVKGGMESVDDTTHSSGMFIGSTGIALGGGKFKVTSAGALTAKSGYIGNGSTGWTIGNTSIYNGASSYGGSTAGIYVGVEGVWIYKDASHNIKLDKSTGVVTIKGGKTGIGVASASQTTGVYFGSDGIAFGRTSETSNGATTYLDAFSVTSNGVLTARSGTIGGWTIGVRSLSKLDMNGSTVVSNVGMSSNGSIAFYAGQTASASDCAFKVTKTGKVYLTTLYTRVPDESQPGYDPNDSSTWHTWIDSQVDLGKNGFKIGDDYKTVKSVKNGKVTLSDGSTFNIATSVKIANAIWGGFVEDGVTYKTIELHTTGNTDVKTFLLWEEASSKAVRISCGALGFSESFIANGIYNRGYDAVTSTAEWSHNNSSDYTGNSNTLNVDLPNKTSGASRSRTFAFSTEVSGTTVKIKQGGHVRFQRAISNSWQYQQTASSGTAPTSGYTWAKEYSAGRGNNDVWFYIIVNGERKYIKVHLTG